MKVMEFTRFSSLLVVFLPICCYVQEIHSAVVGVPEVEMNETHLNDPTSTGGSNTFVKCKIDEHCSPHGYCHTTSGVCSQCFNCTQYFRKNNSSNVCIRNIDECGPCLPGYHSTLHKGRWCSKDVTIINTVSTEKHITLSIMPASEISMFIILGFCCTCLMVIMYTLHYKRRADSGGNVNDASAVTQSVPPVIYQPPPPTYTEFFDSNECTSEGTIQYSLSGPPSLADDKAVPFIYEGTHCNCEQCQLEFGNGYEELEDYDESDLDDDDVLEINDEEVTASTGSSEIVSSSVDNTQQCFFDPAIYSSDEDEDEDDSQPQNTK